VDLKYYKTAHKTFIAALESFASNKQKFKRYYNDKRLTVQEKNILKAKISIRNFKIEEGLEFLDFTPMNDYIKAHQLYIKGVLHNNKTDFSSSAPILKTSYLLFKSLNDDQYSFSALYSLILTFFNLKFSDQMDFYLKEMNKMSRKTKFQKSCYLRCKSLYFSLINEDVKALEYINQSLEDDSIQMKDQRAMFLITKFVAHFKLHQHEKCGEVLKEYNSSKGFISSANYNFMKKMLDHFVNDTPLYAYEKHFRDAPELKYQTNVIKHLSCAENDLAQNYWEKLQIINPSLYKETFQFTGDYCLFSACLNKHLNKETSSLSGIQEFRGTTQEKLVFFLESSERPLSKEELIDYLWAEDWTPGSSARLNTLMSRTKFA